MTITLLGQVRGGKNNMIVLSNGRHIPRANFSKWRDDALYQIKKYRPAKPIDTPCKIIISYVPGDARRRDVPAILDALFHVLERGGIVADDSLIKNVEFITRGINRINSGCVISLVENGFNSESA